MGVGGATGQALSDCICRSGLVETLLMGGVLAKPNWTVLGVVSGRPPPQRLAWYGRVLNAGLTSGITGINAVPCVRERGV
jgi:hypothetical protein